MATELEELQAKEFLKRAEIRTMKKDLRALREGDALKERDKIAHIKTLEEQRLEQEEKLKAEEQKKIESEKNQREKVLGENATQERLAEKDLKQYATEEEHQQIFLYESQRLAFEKKVEEIDSKKDPALKLEKNKILLEKRDWQTKLNSVLEQEKKFEEEQSFISKKSETSTIASEKKSLEERRWEIEKEIQEIEKKRWAVEKELETVENKIGEIDKSSELLIAEKNDLNQKILGVDKSLREIYSGIIARVQEQKKGKLEEQKIAAEAIAKVRAEEKEKIQRQQWAPPVKQTNKPSEKIFSDIPVPAKKRVVKISDEEEQRKKFMQNVESWAQRKETPMAKEVPLPPKK